MPSQTIRHATFNDIPFLLALEQSSHGAAHWSEQQYRDLLAPNGARLVLVAEEPLGSILGFLVARHLAPEWELENIVVAPAARRQGVGKWLLRALLDRARETNSAAVFLEVRESNAAARILYERAGFTRSGRRKAYYSSPPEDAILYRYNPRKSISL